MSMDVLLKEEVNISNNFGCFNGYTTIENPEYSDQFKLIKKAKKHFLITGEIPSVVRKPIAESWKACARQGLIPESQTPDLKSQTSELNKTCENNKFLTEVSSSIIGTICKTIKNINFCIQLFDNSGYLMYACNVENSKNYTKKLPKFELGYCAINKNAATGAVALALSYKENFSVYGPEHFPSELEDLNCDSTLIRNNDQKIIGVINVVYFIDAINTLIPSLATTVSELIEQQFINDHHTSIVNQTLDHITEGALLVDSNLKPIKANPSFLKIIDQNEDFILNIKTTKLFKDIDLINFIKSEKKHISINETVISLKNNFFRLNVNISKIYSGNYFDGLIILCREIKDIIKLSQKFTDNQLFTFKNIMTKDKSMIELIKNCEKVSSLNLPILLEGPSGTGKELFAQSIHNSSSYKNKPFVAVNCAALPINLVESELFGYEKGAFTGALSTGKTGKFEQANGGTIFLDEIGELPLDIQAKFLRILDNHKLTRMGGNKEIKLNIRVIAATNRDLYNEVTLKNFREDLYYRLNVMNFSIPPLKRRYGDIPLLTDYFLKNLNEANSCSKGISQKTMDILTSHEWIGNVRELQNVITRSFYLCENEIISPDYLPDYMNRHKIPEEKPGQDFLKSSIQQTEKNKITQELHNCGGNVKITAESLNIPLSSLYKKIKFHEIKPLKKLYK